MPAPEPKNHFIVAERMTVDGARFSLPHAGDDEYFRRKLWVEELLTAHGMTDAEVRNAVKASVVGVNGKRGHYHLDCFWVSGKAAEIIGSASERFAACVSEIHVKCFWVERYDGAHNAFIDALWSSKFAITLAGFRGKPRAAGRRTSGHKGARIGNPSSDHHKVIYKGRGEKTGMESHVKGRQLQRLKETATERNRTERKRNPSATLWRNIVEEVVWYAAWSLLKSLREAGINVCDYFSAVSSVSWERALYSDDAEALDNTEEAWYVSTHTARLSRQLQLPEVE